MILELEAAVIIVIVAPWGKFYQAWHKWSENKKLAAEHVENEKMKQAIARENHNV